MKINLRLATLRVQILAVILACSGCSAIQVAKNGITGGDIREDITSITQQATYSQTAREFLDDEAMRGLLKTPDDVKSYCKSYAGETSQKMQKAVYSTASALFTGAAGKNQLIEKPKMDFAKRNYFCNNFLSFVNGLTPDERRKLLIFLGNDYFSAYWMAQKISEEDYFPTMQLSKESKTMIEDSGFDETYHPNAAMSDSGLRGYLQKRFNWQTRNAGIAMLGWFRKIDIDRDLGLVNPASVDELQAKFKLYRYTGFAWVSSDRHNLALRGGVHNLRTFSNSNGANNKASQKVVDVWGATEYINSDDLIENVHKFFEPFKPSQGTQTLFYALGRKNPDMVLIKKAVVDTIDDGALQDVKNYARWLFEKKQPVVSSDEGK